MKTVVRLLLGACVAAALALWLGPGLLGWLSSWMAGPAAPASADSSTPYYVVQSPVDGQPEHLYDIAVRTLGDGNRYREIFELNRDRVQPDGGRLAHITDHLQPGWILLLPADATGPAVRVGEPPPAAGGRPAVALRLSTTTILAGLVVLGLVALAARAVTARRSRAGRVAPAPGYRDHDADPWLPPPVDPFAETIAMPDARTALAPLTSPVPAPAVATATPMPDSPPTTIAAEPVPRDRAPASVEPFEGEVAAGGGTWRVRLTGVRVPADTPAWRWLNPNDDPVGVMPIVLGHDGARRLCVDLAQAPSTFTITGPLEMCRDQVRRLMAQIRASGRTVVVVGDALGEARTPGDWPATISAQLAGVESASRFPTEATDLPPGIVVTAGLEPAELPAAHQVATRTHGQTVAVVIGPVLRAPWSMSVKQSTKDLVEQTPGGLW